MFSAKSHDYRYTHTTEASKTQSSYQRHTRSQPQDPVLALLQFSNFHPNLQEKQLFIPLDAMAIQIERCSEILDAITKLNKLATRYQLPELCSDSADRLKMVAKGVSSGSITCRQYLPTTQDVDQNSYVLYSCIPSSQEEGYLATNGELTINLAKAKLFESLGAATAAAQRRSSRLSQWQVVGVRVELQSLGPRVDNPNAFQKADVSASSLDALMAQVNKNALEQALKHHSMEQIMAKWSELHPEDNAQNPHRSPRRM